MPTPIAEYRTPGGERHVIELIELADGGALLIDRAGRGPRKVVAELNADEGPDAARAVLDGGGYLDRAGRQEPSLCRAAQHAELEAAA